MYMLTKTVTYIPLSWQSLCHIILCHISWYIFWHIFKHFCSTVSLTLYSERASVTRVVGTLAEELRNAHKNSGCGGRGNYICRTQKLYTIYTKENPINRLLSGTTLSQLIEVDQFGTFSTPAPPKKASRIIIPIFCGCKQQFVTSLWPQRVSNISIFRSPGSTFRC